jgi:hypothetical protein
MTQIRHHHEWLHGLMWSSFGMTIMVFICLMAFAIITIRHRQQAIGIVLAALAIVCVPGLPIGLALGLIYGWTKSRDWRLRGFMAGWTGLSIVWAVNCIGYLYVRFFTEPGLFLW